MNDLFLCIIPYALILASFQGIAAHMKATANKASIPFLLIDTLPVEGFNLFDFPQNNYSDAIKSPEDNRAILEQSSNHKENNVEIIEEKHRVAKEKLQDHFRAFKFTPVFLGAPQGVTKKIAKTRGNNEKKIFCLNGLYLCPEPNCSKNFKDSESMCNHIHYDH